MTLRGILSALAVLLGLFPLTFLHGAESNFWPLRVRTEGSPQGRPDHTGSLGPFLSLTERDATRIFSFRPFWTSFHNRETGSRSAHLLYPLVNWMDNGDFSSGHVLNLLQYRHNRLADETFLRAFPILFSLQTPRSEDSYFALWPIGGTLKNRLWRDQISFIAWPLFVRTLKGDEVRTHVPYPFVQHLGGPHSQGFGIWPVYGHFERENDYAHTWAAWPFFYHYRDKLDEAVPYERFGILPFYTRETGAGLRSETFIWPFFGYTHESDPRPAYRERRYFWPFLVQGRGEERRVNRWMPFYTHETEPGYSKRWFAWPLLELETFKEPGLIRERTSLLYFLYRDERQRFAGTEARLNFLWPFYGYWNDGYERRQLQVLDPLSLFFPFNRKVRENWTPLFALYRLDERAGNTRHSLFWDLIVWEREPEGLKALYAGPLFEWVESSHWSFLKGLVSSQVEDGERTFNLFWMK